MKQSSAAPTRKLMAATLAGAIATIIIDVLGNNGFVISDNAAFEQALVVIIMAVTGYYVPPGEKDNIEPK